MTTEAPLQTTPEVGGMGHSVKRKEDPRFIRGAGRVHRRRQPAGPALARHRPQPVRPRDDQGHRRSRGAQDPGRRSPSSPARTSRRHSLHWMPTLAGDKQMVLPTDTVMYQAQEVAAVIATSRYAAADGVAAVAGRLRAAAGHRRPVQGARGRTRSSSARTAAPDKQTNHIWHWESGDEADGRRGARRGRGHGRRGHLHPAHPRRLDRDLRLRRRLGRGPRPADAAHDHPGAARDPDGPRACVSGPARSRTSGSRPTTSAAASAARCRSTRATSSRSPPR